MPTNITDINEAQHLGELDPIYVLQDNSVLLARTNGIDNRMPFDYFYKQVIDIAKSETFNAGYNADFLDGVAVDTENTSDQRILMYHDTEGAYVPTDLKPNHIDWSDFDENDFVKIDANGQLVPSDILVTDLKPTDTASAGRFLQVDASGTMIIESDFDLDNFLNYPDVSEDNANYLASGIFVAGYSTTNRDGADQAYIISSRLRNDPNVVVPRAAQLSISTDSDKISFRRNDGTLSIDNFTPWTEIYHESSHPISDQIDSDSSINIASSKAVKSVNNKIDQLSSDYTGSTILSKLVSVDGSGSNLDADKLDGYHFSDLDARFLNASGDTVNGTLTVRNGHKIRLEKGTSYADLKAHDSYTILDSNNPVILNNASQKQNLYTGGLLVSSNYSESNLIPTNGIYSRGKVVTGTGIDVGTTAVVDSSGKISWNNLKNVPSRVDNLGTASTYDVGSGEDQLPRNRDIVQALMPPGAVIPFAGNVAPEGWLACDGRAISRSTYASLFNYIGTIYGNGNGSTTFNIPDLRDEFVRGASATRPVGASEGDQFRSHSHSGTTNTTGSHKHTGSTDTTGEHSHTYTRSNYVNDNSGPNGLGADGEMTSYETDKKGNHSHSLSVDNAGNHSHSLNISSAGGAETRPRNIALLYCIKY